MEICASVIVTFYPNPDCIENIINHTSLCTKVIVVDNTPAPQPVKFPEIYNLTVFYFKENMGLATALNRGIAMAGEEGYQDIFLFDQDSRVPDNFFRDMLCFKSEMNKWNWNYAAYVPNFFDRNSKTYAKFPTLSRFTVKNVPCDEIQLFSPDRAIIAITSGTLIDFAKFNEVGPMRDDYFIDFIDNEYCLRIYKSGYKIAVNCDVTLNHAIGNRVTHRFLNITIKPNHHLPVRRYYIFRNGLRTAFDYKRAYPSYFLLITARLIHELLAILFYENLKTKKLRAILWGFFHSLSNTMGRCLIRSSTEEEPE